MKRALQGLVGMLLIMLFANVGDAGLAYAQREPAGTIKGTLIDRDTKNPLIGANILINGTGTGAAADEDGTFLISNVPVGTYVLRLSYIGYDTRTLTDVIVRSNRITYIDEALVSSRLSSGEVVVNAGYFSDEEPSSVTTFSREEIRRAPGSAGDISRILFGLPGIAKVNDTRNSLIVRGGGSFENGFYLDNIPVPNINHFPEQGASGGPIGMLNVDFVHDIEFRAGGFSAAYPDRLSSVMTIDLREGNRDEFDAQFDFSLSGLGVVGEGPFARKKGSWIYSARRSFLDFIVGAIGEEGTSVPQYSDFQGKFVYNLSPKHRVSVLHLLGRDGIKQGRESAVENGDNMYNDVSILQHTGGINWDFLWGNSGYSSTSLSHSIVDYDFRVFETRKFAETGIEHALLDQQGAEQQVQLRNVNFWKINPAHSLEFGIESRLMLTDYDHQYGTYNDFMGNVLPALTVRKNINAVKVNPFMNYTWRPTSRFTINPGVQASYFSYNQNTHLLPRLALSYDVTARMSLHASAGMYAQTLPLILLSQEESNLDLNDPRSRHLVAGFHYLLSENTRLTVEAYHKKYRHMLLEPTQPSLFVLDEMVYTGVFLPHRGLVDQGRGYSQGVEFTLQKKLARKLYGLASVSLSESRYRDLNGIRRDRGIDSRFSFHAEGGYKPNNRWEFSMRWIYAGGVPYTPFDVEASRLARRGVYDENRINSERLPAYHSLNIRVDRRFYLGGSNLITYLSVWNAYGRKNISSYYWNEIDNNQSAYEQWGTLPIIGIEFEF